MNTNTLWPFSLKCLVASSVILFLSIFSTTPKLMGLGFIQFIAIIGWNIKTLLFKNTTVTDFIMYNAEQATTAYHSKKFFKSVIYWITAPIMLVSLVFTLLSIYALLVLI